MNILTKHVIDIFKREYDATIYRHKILGLTICYNFEIKVEGYDEVISIEYFPLFKSLAVEDKYIDYLPSSFTSYFYKEYSENGDTAYRVLGETRILRGRKNDR